MRKLLIVPVLLFSLVTISFGQKSERVFRKFKGELSFGYARFPNNADIKNGFVITIEPKFLLMDQLAISARLENTILGKNVENFDGTTDDNFELKAYQSALFAAEYYFTKDFKVRPFVGGGAGVYTVVATGSKYYDDYNGDGTYGQVRQAKFGGMFRAGVELKHLRIGLEYNIIPNTTVAYYEHNDYTGFNEVVTRTNKNSYFSIKIGYCFGGGLLKND